jgi:hypothetical protein
MRATNSGSRCHVFGNPGKRLIFCALPVIFTMFLTACGGNSSYMSSHMIPSLFIIHHTRLRLFPVSRCHWESNQLLQLRSENSV